MGSIELDIFNNLNFLVWLLSMNESQEIQTSFAQIERWREVMRKGWNYELWISLYKSNGRE